MSGALREAKAVKEGSRLAVIAPSSPFDRAAFDRGVVRLRRRYDVRFNDSLFSKQGYLAGDDDRRTSEILAALRDPEIDFLVAARGGFGVTRILPRIPVEEVERARKLLVGFSDVTGLHALWHRADVQSIHGPMVCALGDEGPDGEQRFERWVAAVEGESGAPVLGLQKIVGGQGRGRLIGGNLSVLCALVGTEHALATKGAIVFLEDVGERPYRVDRMLTQLLNAQFFTHAAGVVVGQFTESKRGADGTDVESVIRERLATLTIPVVMNAPSGHIDDNLPLPFGRDIRLDADAGALER